MDTQCFDALARRLGAADSRRRVLTALLAATLGPIVRGSAVDEVAANCKRGKQFCSVIFRKEMLKIKKFFTVGYYRIETRTSEKHITE